MATFASAQEKPGSALGFCGFRYKDTVTIEKQFREELDFLRIKDGETIVDIGASGGAMEGWFSVIGSFRNVNFILVDPDSNCLNNTRLNNMIAYYASVKGKTLQQKFSIVNNTADSLYLPADTYRKVWLFNTLHEIPDKDKMIRSIAQVMQKGGELVILELLSRPKHLLHGGCHQPLLDEDELKILLERNGFKQTDNILNPNHPKKIVNPLYLVRFVKN